MEVASVRLPLRVIVDAAGWNLTAWLVKVGSKVYRNQRVAAFQSPSTGAVDHALAPHGGIVTNVFVSEGTLVSADLMADRERVIAQIEYCPHSVVFSGLCAVCGEEASVGHFADVPNASFARLPVAYNVNTLSVTRAEAEKIATVTAQRLLRNRRLSLVLDLDHTLIHATDDPRAIAVIDHSPSGVDLSSISSFSLNPDSRYTVDEMHVKLRPYLSEFLVRCSELFELHIYTMGSRPYADRIAQLIDPDKRLFRGRITSREDFDEGRCNQKNISRLFPCDDSMVLIIDDREDVWLSGTGATSMPNLIRAKPYTFWNGLHEAYDRALVPGTTFSSSATSIEPISSASPYHGAVQSDFETPNLDDSGNAGQHKVKQSPRTEEARFSSQSTPTLQADVENPTVCAGRDGSAGSGARSGEAENRDVLLTGGNSASKKQSFSLKSSPMPALSRELCKLVAQWWENDKSIKGGCDHLKRLADVLEICHARFFGSDGPQCTVSEAEDVVTGRNNGVDNKSLSPSYVKRNNGIAMLTPSCDGKLIIPADIKIILADIRSSLLADCVLTFTGIFPLSINPEDSPLWELAVRHGAKCTRDFELGHTTHVLACPERGANTDKTRVAIDSGSAFCVDVLWLEDSVTNFEVRPELWYSLHIKTPAQTWEDYRSSIKEGFRRARATLTTSGEPLSSSTRSHAEENASQVPPVLGFTESQSPSTKNPRIRVKLDAEELDTRPTKFATVETRDKHSRANLTNGNAVVNDQEIDDALNEALLA